MTRTTILGAGGNMGRRIGKPLRESGACATWNPAIAVVNCWPGSAYRYLHSRTRCRTPTWWSSPCLTRSCRRLPQTSCRQSVAHLKEVLLRGSEDPLARS